MRRLLPVLHRRRRVLPAVIAVSVALIASAAAGCENAKRPIAFDDNHTAGDEKEQGNHSTGLAGSHARADRRGG